MHHHHDRPHHFHGRGPGGHRWGGGRGWSGARRRRVLDQGDLRFVILQLIAEKPRHGYEVIKAIEENLGGAYAPSPGVVYPTLQMLEELGHAALSSEEGGKKLYAITDAGRAFLAENADAAAAAAKRMDHARTMFAGGPPPQIVRAMENLRLALHLQLERGQLSEARATEIATAIDAVVGEIEKP